jgi:hypothetical protein
MFLRDVYEAKWISGDRKSSQNLMILQENLKKPEVIRVADSLNINMDLFLRVMKAAYSVIAVLRQIKK